MKKIYFMTLLILGTHLHGQSSNQKLIASARFKIKKIAEHMQKAGTDKGLEELVSKGNPYDYETSSAILKKHLPDKEVSEIKDLENAFNNAYDALKTNKNPSLNDLKLLFGIK